MEIEGEVIVITGAASGIGLALANRFKTQGASALVLVDVDYQSLAKVAQRLEATAVVCDVGREDQVQALIQTTEEKYGHIDLFCANAGILRAGGVEATSEEWRQVMDINIMAHVYAVRAALPRMIARGKGYFMFTVSAAGLLSQLNSASYSVSKHAALAFAEWLQISHGHQGIKVSALCPQAVATKMNRGSTKGVAAKDGLMQPGEVAAIAVEGIRQEEFLILPHTIVKKYILNKARDHSRWIKGMQRLREEFL